MNNMVPISQFVLQKNKNNTQCSTCQRYQRTSQEDFSPVASIDFEAKEIDESKMEDCIECENNLKKLTVQRKLNIQIEYENAKLKEQVERLTSDNQHLIKKLEQRAKKQTSSNPSEKQLKGVKEDLEAELFECKFLNQLLILGQYRNQETIKEKYEKILIDNFILQEKLMIRDKIIEQRQFYPLYHYDARIRNLRSAVLHWYHLATKDCKKIKQELKDIKTQQKYLAEETGKQILEIGHKVAIQREAKVRKPLKTNSSQIESSHLGISQCKEHQLKNDQQVPEIQILKVEKRRQKKRSEKKGRKYRSIISKEKSRHEDCGHAKCSKPKCISNFIQIR